MIDVITVELPNGKKLIVQASYPYTQGNRFKLAQEITHVYPHIMRNPVEPIDELEWRVTLWEALKS